MRQTQASSNGDFNAKAIAGTHTVLIALNCKDQRRKGLKGFAFQREMVGPGGTGPKWLRSQKVFKSVVPDPKNAHDPDRSRPSRRRFYTNKFPIQSFLWGDYAARAGHAISISASCRCTASPARSPPIRKDEIEVRRSRPRRNGPRARRTASGSTAAPSPARSSPRNSATSRRRTSTIRTDPEVKWLSRGLLEACLEYINETKPAMRCASPPTNSPIRRSSTRFKALHRQGHRRADRLSRHRPTPRAAQRNRDEGGRPADQRPEDHLPALEDQDPAQQVHRPAQERHRSGRSVDRLDQFHALRLPRPDQCRPSHRRRRDRQAISRVLEGREDRSGTGRCTRPSSWR